MNARTLDTKSLTATRTTTPDRVATAQVPKSNSAACGPAASWPLSETRYVHPAAREFADSLGEWLAPESILLEDVDAGPSGVIDIVVVGTDSTMGVCFDAQTLDRPVPYFVDRLYLMNPLDVVDSTPELLYILLKSVPMLFAEKAKHQLPRQARMDLFNFTRPRQGRLSSYEITTAIRRNTPLVLRVLAANPGQNPVSKTGSPAAA